MLKRSTLLLCAFLFGAISFAQDLLDTERYKDAELFVEKKDYDVQQRLAEINSIHGKQVTVFEVSGKQNKIKRSYTGTVDGSGSKDFSDKQNASLIVVEINEGGRRSAYFPLTNRKDYRIYLTERMK